MTPLSDEQIASYKNQGFVVLRGAVPSDLIRDVEIVFESIVGDIWPIGSRGGMHTPAFARWLSIQTESAQERYYVQMRSHRFLRDVCDSTTFRYPISQLFGEGNLWKLTDHCRFRMDQPHDTRHLAVWHQDHAYVGGSTETITSWFPLQDVDWPMGPLLVDPGSHKFGPAHHEQKIGKRRCADTASERAFSPMKIEMLPMRRGDLLLFHSLLLHSGQVNLTDRVRFSIQARYEPVTQ